MPHKFISEWKSEVCNALLQSNSLCMALYSADRTLLFCNEGFRTLLVDDPCDSLINPSFEKLISLENGESESAPIFNGYLTVGNNQTVNTSILANIYRKKNMLLIVGGIDIVMLLEQNNAVLRMNSEISKLQREIIRKNKQLEKTIEELDHANAELLELNQTVGAINKKLKANLEEINLLNNNLELKNDALYQLNATKDKFFGIIAHDLKNPFNSILGFSELLIGNIQSYKTDKIVDFVKIIHNSSTKAHNLLENLLVWARAQSGRITFNPTVNNLAGIIQENISLIEAQTTKKEIRISAEIDDAYCVFCDLNMINMVVRNLLTNAVKFTNRNGQITVSPKQTDKGHEITISDTGVGIAPENVQKLFRIDSKFQEQGTEAEKGTGLGLILCKEFVEKHGGEIWVESQVGKGSDFKFTLPIYEEV